LKLAVAALIRNEIDIIGAFLQHLDAVFDHVLLMNHHSIDGTDRVMESACAQRPNWTMWQVEPTGYHQTAFSIFALRHLFTTTDADIVMFLDADEFIDVPNRATLERAFSILTNPDAVGGLRWRYAVPARVNERAIAPGEPLWRAPEMAPLGKVAIPRIFYERHGGVASLGIGNHGLYFGTDKVVPVIRCGEIVHLPIRSHEQLKSKVLVGAFSVMSIAARNPLQCWHWYDILWRIADGTLRDEDLIGIAAHYGEQGKQTTQSMSFADLQAAGYERSALNMAFGEPLPPIPGPLTVDPARLVAASLRHFQIEQEATGDGLMLEGNILRFIPQENQQ
jgi:hypothetical protein